MYSNIYSRSSRRTRRLPFVHQFYLVKTLLWIFAITGAATHAFAQDCPPSPTVNPYIGGKVFLDYGHDGTFNSGIDQPISGVTVIAYTANSTIASATSSADGTYLITDALLLVGTSYRVEFSNFPSGHQQSFSGTNNGTSVQFVTANSCNVNLALTDPNFYCQAAPKFVTNCYIENDNTSSSGDVMISINYNSVPTANDAGDAVLISHEAIASAIGTTYGLAYQRHSKTMFASAYMKRFAGFGPNGSGAIYKISNPSDGALSGELFVDLNTLFGSAIFGTDPHNFTTKTGGGDVIDANSYNAVTRNSFGDIDISEDEKTLYAINLNDRSLYIIPLGSDPANPTPPGSSSDVTVIPLADTDNPLPDLPTVNNAEIRPFALKSYKGTLYIGIVTNGQNGGDLRGLVYAYKNGTFTKELDFSLDYNRGCAFGNGTTCYGPAKWNAWHNANTRPTVTVNGEGEQGFPQPILADIEFDAAGNMILGLRDRFGDQEGNQAPIPTSPFSLVRGDAFGDLLKATKNSGNGWSINMADFTDPSTARTTSEPVFGDDNYFDSPYFHEETGMGGLGVLLRQNGLVVPVMDPKVAAFSNGIDWYNLSTSNAARTKSITVLTGASFPFGKSYGLGEIEFVCDLAPIQIGNRVWKDTNANGTQDPDELGVNGVEIELYKGTSASGSPIATTTTANGGQWYFSSKSHLGAGWTGTGADTTLLAETDYTIKVKTALQSGALITCTAFSTKDATGIGAADLADSDVNSDGTISYKTGAAGVNNHTLDIGVTECVTPVAAISPKNQESCENGDAPMLLTVSLVTGTATSYTWYGPLADTTGSFGTAINGATGTTYQPIGTTPGTFYYAVIVQNSSSSCADTVFAKLVVKPKPLFTQIPTALCKGESVNLNNTFSTTNGPVNSTFYNTFADLDNNVNALTSPIVTPDTTRFYYVKFINPTTGCGFTDATFITVNLIPTAGPDLTGGGAICNTIATVDLPNVENGEIWSQLGSVPKAVNIDPNTGIVSGMDAIGTYQFILSNPSSGCADTVSVEVKNCLKGSIGDLIWKDANDDGIQNLPTEKGVQGVIVQLLNNDNNDALLATDTTDAGGIYSFNDLNSGKYKVKIVLSSLPDTCQISPKQDVNTGDGNDTNDSDFNPATGESPVIVIDVTKTQTDKDNPTVDAALYVPCLKPSAGTDVTLCQGITTIDLKNAGTYEVWSKGAQPANTTASINAATGLVTGLSSTGDYYFILTYKANAVCSDTVKVTVNTIPNAGTDMTGGNAICNSAGSVNLPDAANGQTWAQLGTAPKTTSVNAATGEVSGMDVVGTYQFILSNATTDCADTVSVEVKNCLKGSIGDLVWKDVNDNGIQDLPTEKGVQGVIVQLLNNDNNDALLATDTTDANGIYSFNGLDSGNYKVKIVLSSLPDTCQISPKQDVNTGGGNDTNDSDFNPTTGESPVIEINTLKSGINKDNPTVDAALIIPCIKPVWNLTTVPVCSPTAAVYSVSFAVTNKTPNLKVNAGTLTGTNPYTITGIPNGTNLVITDSLRANCKYDTTIVAPDCSCPQINLLTPNATACIGDTLPTLRITLLGTNTNGVSANWFANATGGSALASGLSFKPTGLIAANDTFFVELTGVTGNCIDLPRTAVVVTALNCEIDLALKKSISTKIAHIGDTLTYTLKVWNEFTNDASGVEVTDSIATSVQFLNGSFTASRGGAVITGNVIKWTIGNIAAGGDTVTLTYKVKATQEGVHFNTAEISKTNEKDIDSTPGNGTDDEDDIDRQCFTVPVKLCPGEKVEVNIPAKYVNVQWFKDGGTNAIAAGNEILFTQPGTYTFTATNNTCPAEGCCPIIIEPGDNCCPEDICIPFTIKQTKKAGKSIQ